MATNQQVDDVIVAVVDHLGLTPHMAFGLGLVDEAIQEAMELGYVERRGDDFYPTPDGKEYRQLIQEDTED